MKNNKFLYGWKIYVNYGFGWEYESFETGKHTAKTALSPSVYHAAGRRTRIILR